MTGPEHYREAEKLATKAARWSEVSDASALYQLAQVHATLALASATALPSGASGSASRNEWVMATSGLGPSGRD